MDIRKITLDNNDADVILASDILEHFSHKEIDNISKNGTECLKLLVN